MRRIREINEWVRRRNAARDEMEGAKATLDLVLRLESPWEWPAGYKRLLDFAMKEYNQAYDVYLEIIQLKPRDDHE
jgi:hypothetical protein